MTFSQHGTAVQTPVRKNPLRVAGMPAITGTPAASPPGQRRRQGLSGAALRRLMISEYGVWLQSRTNKHHRPFQQDTVKSAPRVPASPVPR
jgi:hypothetical protein